MAEFSWVAALALGGVSGRSMGTALFSGPGSTAGYRQQYQFTPSLAN
jgi:hypothetical protein